MGQNLENASNCRSFLQLCSLKLLPLILCKIKCWGCSATHALFDAVHVEESFHHLLALGTRLAEVDFIICDGVDEGADHLHMTL